MERSVKRMKLIWLCICVAVISAPVHAADLKIGVVNAAAVMEQSPQKTRALARLEKEFSSRSKSIESKVKAIRAKQEKLVKDGAIYSAEQMKTKERELVSEQRDIKRLQDEYSEDLSIRRNEELRKLEKEIAKTIVDLAKAESYDLIVFQGVIFASDKVDITEKVLKSLKSQ